jgi:2-keto-3-deoxy-L-rhamnonate aldolase RhmA
MMKKGETTLGTLVTIVNPDIAETKRALDVGAHGLVVPLVNNKEDAKKAVAYTRYNPRGVTERA